jgi:hypothetical protein
VTPSAAEVGWLAGLYEGEGCLGPLPQGGWELVIVSTDLDVLLRVWAMTGLGRIGETPRGAPHHKQVWRWKTAARDSVIEVLTVIEPMLLARRRQRVHEALAWYAEHPRKWGGAKQLY